MYRVFLSLLVFSFNSFVSDPTCANAEPEFYQVVRDIGESDELVGLAIAVVRRGDVESIQTFGVREFGKPEQIDAQTTFRIASLSKGFAATVVAELVDEGKLALNDPISKFNQDFQLRNPTQTKSATLAHVLSHRLSLPPYAYDNLLEAGVAPSTILRDMKKVTPICKVGSCYAYQNVGFDTITSAIELVVGQNYSEVVRNRLFTPLDMNGASFGKENLTRADNWARSHQATGRDAQGTQHWRVREVKQAYYNLPAAGGINASISDMAKWLVAQMGYAPKVIPSKRLTELHTPLVATPAELRRNRRMEHLRQAHYGLGWRIYQYANQAVVVHSGSVEGYTAQIAFLPELDVGIVLLANSRSKEFWRILPQFLDSELGLD